MVLHMILIQPLVIVTPPKMTSIAFFLTEDKYFCHAPNHYACASSRIGIQYRGEQVMYALHRKYLYLYDKHK